MAAPSPDRLLQQFWRVAAHYADVIRKRAETHGYSYAAHYGPHDLEARDWSSETAKPRVEIAKDLHLKTGAPDEQQAHQSTAPTHARRHERAQFRREDPQRLYPARPYFHSLSRSLARYSLDAQREACEAYVKSQAHEGWRLIADRYDDGAFSGASLDRPALQKLLADVRAGKIHIVVVYKVDRLTRSLADFAKLVELFDRHGVSFVSITQSFNTTSSMGRLTLNALLSFAQFEREVIGERVRDKIAASKRKGIWVGGPVPLGYRCIDKKLVVVPEEAEAVRIIFTRYLALGSIAALIEDLDRRGIRTKANGLADGRMRGGVRFGVGSVGHLLRNRFYIGEVVYRGEVHRAKHEPIVDRDLFAAVQAKLAANAVARQVRLKGSAAILAGRLFDDRGNRMSPTHSNKLGVRYRYYVSHAIVQQRKAESGSVARVPAPEIENLVLDGVRKHLAAIGEVEHPTTLADRDLIDRYVDRVVVKPRALEVRLVLASEASAPTAEPGVEDPEPCQILPTTITLAWTAPSFGAVKGIVHAPASMALPSRTDCAPWASATSLSPQARLGRTASPKG
jgi:site-specific DNA recombinase